MNEIKNNTSSIFDSIKHIDENGNEYWLARELQKALTYKEWRKFKKIIKKAIQACNISKYESKDHFVHVDKMVNIGSKTKRSIEDFRLSRYACYLIAQNGDSHIKVISLAQTYFAIQTRKIELLEQEYNMLTEDEKRLYQRSLTKKGNYELNQTLKKQELKTLINFITLDIKDYIMGRLQMI